MIKKYQLTSAGLSELKLELERLREARFQTAEDIKIAREFGDLSENAEYQIARQNQEKNESRISEVEYILSNAAELKKPKVGSKAKLGSAIELEDTATGNTTNFIIVGTLEADPLEGKISEESMVAKAVKGKKEGEIAEVEINGKTKVYKIVSVT